MEAIFPVCGAGGPQLKRNPLGGAIMPMILTVLEAHVDSASQGKLHAAYADAANDQLPPGLLRSTLSHATDDSTQWRIETLWESREALEAMQGSGTPRGILIFRAAGAEPTVSAYVVTMILAPSNGAA